MIQGQLVVKNKITNPSPDIFWTSLGLIQLSSTGGGTGVDTVSVDTSPMIDRASFVAWYIRRTSSRRAASSGDSSISELCTSVQLSTLLLTSLQINLLHCVQKKNTHSRFLLYLCGKCLDLHKIFRVCLSGIKYSGDLNIHCYRWRNSDVICTCL